MTKSIEVQGRTEDEAIELALEQLGLSRDDVSVEILETAKTGLFGLKNTPAVVKVEYESDEEEESAPAADSEAPKSKSKTAAKSAAKTAAKNAQSASTPPGGELNERITAYLEGLFKHMDLEVNFTIEEKDGAISVTLTADDPGVLIGRRGETLDALQHLTNYSINRSAASRVRIHLDAENYRRRRSEALESLAIRTAGKVVKYRKNLTLDPMNAYERHIIHATLQNHEHISTFSVGNETNRRVVVAYGQSAKSNDREKSPQYKEWH